MVSVRGTFRNGSAQPEEVVDGQEGQPVLITFLEGAATPSPEPIETDWEALTQLLKECEVDTGIEDLAHQHEHYLYGTPKQPDPSE